MICFRSQDTPSSKPINTSLSWKDFPRNKSDILPVSHVFLVSAYYYPTSKSLGKNAIALNMLVDSFNFDILNVKFNIIGSNETKRHLSVARSILEREIPACRYVTTVALTNTVPALTKVEIESNGVSVEIPFKVARLTAPKPFIICISPQFVAEQWQIFMMHAHMAHRFGGHLHIYLISIVDSYFDLMKEYERQGYISIDYWLKMKFKDTETPYFDPNAHTELRNQMGAQTDCLLQYKEVADYVAFFDMDDILVPLNYPTYVEEFQAEWAKHPHASSLAYGRREHEFIKAETLSSFTFHDIYTSLRSSKNVKAPKIVARTDRYTSVGLHWSSHEPAGKRINIASPNIIHVQRPIYQHGRNKAGTIWKFQFGKFNETIKPEDVEFIEKDIQAFKTLPGITEIGSRLPKTDFYFPIVYKCYDEQVYHRKTLDFQKCPNAEGCILPQRDDIKCIHSDAVYESGPHMEPFTFHFSKNSFWSKDIGCYQ